MRVAVVGAGWSGLASAAFLQARGHDVKVFEASAAPGGRIATLRQDGCLVEHGPHGVIPNAATMGLLDAAGVPLVTAPPRAPRFLVHRGRAVPLPSKPPQALATPLISPRAKLQLLAEPLHRPGPRGETVGAFARRRLGRGVSHVVDAFVTGVLAGDPDRLVLEHAFPEMWRMDQARGLLRGMRRPSGPRPRLTTARDGMESLVRALAAKLDVAYDARVASVRATGDAALVDGERFDRAVVAVEPAAAARLLDVKAPLPPVAPVRIVAFAVSSKEGPPEGYGVLAPEQEARFALGTLFESRLFEGRSPPGEHLVRCLVGGRRHPERATTMSGDEAARRAWDDIKDLGLVRGEPRRTFVLETQGIPQPEASHAAWLAALPKGGPVRVAGIGHRRVGLAGLAAEAETLADTITRFEHP